MLITNLFIASFVTLVPTPEVDSVIVGCETDQECPDYNACENRKCINPCAEDDPCAPSANCKVIGHQPVCTCPDGYIGDPRTECKLRKHAIYSKYSKYIREGLISQCYEKLYLQLHILYL